MRSVTSYFNPALWRKNMQRFWPVWSLYGLVWAFVLPLRMLADAPRYYRVYEHPLEQLMEQAMQVPATLAPGAWVSAIFGVLCVMAVFGYLYSSRSACMMHALPMRRETLFCTSYLSGLSFLLLPNLAIFILTFAVEASIGCLQVWPLVVWLLGQSASCLFFYSFAVFCAMFTGHILALPAFYGILNMLVFAILALVDSVLREMLYGYAGMGDRISDLVYWFTPLYHLTNSLEWGMFVEKDSSTYQLLNPAAVGIYLLVAVALTAASLLVYRRRHVESAGDIVAVRLVRPVFKYGVALCAGLCCGMLTCAVLGLSSNLAMGGFILAWGVVGYFVAEMLLKKSFRVLHAWKGAVALGGVLLLVLVAVNFDVLGIQTRVPQADNVVKVTVSGPEGAPYDSGNSGYHIELTDPQQVQQVLALHQAVVDHRDRAGEEAEDYTRLSVSYQLKNGATLSRQYYSVPLFQEELTVPGTTAYAAEQLLENREYVKKIYGLDNPNQGRIVEAYLDRLWNTNLRGYDTVYLDGSPEALWQAVMQDFDEGTLGVRYLFDSQERQENTCTADLGFSWEVDDSYSRNWAITLTPQASHTLAALEQMGALDAPYELRTNAQQNREDEGVYAQPAY